MNAIEPSKVRRRPLLGLRVLFWLDDHWPALADRIWTVRSFWIQKSDRSQ